LVVMLDLLLNLKLVNLACLKKKFLLNNLNVNWNILVALILKSKEISIVLVKEFEKNLIRLEKIDIIKIGDSPR